MDEGNARKRRTATFIRSASTKRMMERQIAREEKRTERRVGQIVAEALEGREAPSMPICGSLGSAGRRGSRARGKGVRNLGRKPLIFLDSEKEMQGNANVFSLFSTLKTASEPVAARSRKSPSPHPRPFGGGAPAWESRPS